MIDLCQGVQPCHPIIGQHSSVFNPGMRLDVLYEDNHLLAINKRPGIATMGAARGSTSLAEQVRAYLKHKYAKPGNVYLGVVSRLDALVSGVVLFARTSKAAARLTEQFRTRTVEKTYWAIASGSPPPAGELADWMVKDEAKHRMRVAFAHERNSQHAQLAFRRLTSIGSRAWLEVDLLSGRKHQIRLQLASRGWPVLGDRKYGSRESFPDGIALHARQLRFDHPTRDTRIELVAPTPPAWKAFGIESWQE